MWKIWWKEKHILIKKRRFSYLSDHRADVKEIYSKTQGMELCTLYINLISPNILHLIVLCLFSPLDYEFLGDKYYVLSFPPVLGTLLYKCL